MKKMISIFTLCILLFTTNVMASTFFNIPTWSKNVDVLPVNAETTPENFLNLESQSAILIEQTTRQNSL